MIGQIAWHVENMYFNLFVYDTIAPNLDTVTLMVQLSGVVATVTTLIAGTLSDKLGNRRTFISWGYAIWGVTVALFGLISPELVSKLFNVETTRAIAVALTLVVVGDCVMTLFGSTANDACFNAWVTDTTRPEYRGRVEGVLSIMPLLAMLVVAGGFGILVEAMGYPALFICLGAIISASGVVGIFKIKDSPSLQKSGDMKDIIYGFRPSVIKSNKPFYLTLIVVVLYGIASQIFMPYLIIYMKTFLNFSVLEYSIVFGLAIILGAAVNLKLTRLSDKTDKLKLVFLAAGLLVVGLVGMYLFHFEDKLTTLIMFGIAGFFMICGNIFIIALCGATLRDYTPEGTAGKLQGVRMVFSVLIPMFIGPLIGNSINKAMNILIENPGADAMTTAYIPAPEIFLAGAICSLLIFAVVPFIRRAVKKEQAKG